MTSATHERLYISTNGLLRPIGPDDTALRAALEARAAKAYDRCHSDDSFADLKRRARFSKEDQGLLKDWLTAVEA